MAVIFNGTAVKALKDQLRFKNADSEVWSGTFAAANNQTTAANVTGISLSGVRAAKVLISVAIDATADLFESFTLDIVQRGADFDIAQSSVGDESNVDFSITSGGQLQYTSGNESGFVSSTMNYQIQVTAI